MDTVTSPSPFTTQKIDICKGFHPVTNTTRSSSEEFQSQARDERDCMEGKHRGLMTSSTNNRKTGFPQNKRTIFNTFHTHFPPSPRRAWLSINFLWIITMIVLPQWELNFWSQNNNSCFSSLNSGYRNRWMILPKDISGSSKFPFQCVQRNPSIKK